MTLCTVQLKKLRKGRRINTPVKDRVSSNKLYLPVISPRQPIRDLTCHSTKMELELKTLHGALENNPTEFMCLVVGHAILTKLLVTYTITLELKQGRRVVLNEFQLNKRRNPKRRTLRMLCRVQVRRQKSELRVLLCLHGKKNGRNPRRRSGSVICQRLLCLFLCLT